MFNSIEFISLIILLLWLSILTFIVLKSNIRYNDLFKGSDVKTGVSLLKKLSKEQEDSSKNIEDLQSKLLKLQEESRTHIQKVGLLRYNPFKDTGGEQSFVLAFVDENESGIVISGLYSRSGTRWYAKKIANGKGIDFDLSEEEKKAISLAK